MQVDPLVFGAVLTAVWLFSRVLSAHSCARAVLHGIDIPESHWEIDEFCVGDGKIHT